VENSTSKLDYCAGGLPRGHAKLLTNGIYTKFLYHRLLYIEIIL